MLRRLRDRRIRLKAVDRAMEAGYEIVADASREWLLRTRISQSTLVEWRYDVSSSCECGRVSEEEWLERERNGQRGQLPMMRDTSQCRENIDSELRDRDRRLEHRDSYHQILFNGCHSHCTATYRRSHLYCCCRFVYVDGSDLCSRWIQFE